MVCPFLYHPVCGSNGKTYSNLCLLEREACETGQELTMVSDGPCSSAKPNPTNIPGEHCFEGNKCAEDSDCGNEGNCKYYGPCPLCLGCKCPGLSYRNPGYFYYFDTNVCLIYVFRK